MPLNNYAFGKSIRYFRKKRGLSQVTFLYQLRGEWPAMYQPRYLDRPGKRFKCDC